MEIIEAKRMNTVPFSGIRKIMEKGVLLEKQGVKVIHLEIGRPDFDTPANIKECAKKSLDEGKVFYTSNFGIPELRKAIADKLEKENGVVYNPDGEIIVTVGLSEAIFNVMTALLDTGDEILVPDPVWLNYIHVPRMLGAVPVTYNLLEKNNYQLDLQEIESKITSKTKMIAIISPNNPTGGVLNKSVLEKLAAIAIKHNLIVLSDEIYEKIIYDGNVHYSIAAFPGMKERTVTLNGFSKAYSMTGWRLGYIAAPANIIDSTVRTHQYITTCAPSISQYAAVEALKNSQDAVDKMVAEYQRRRDYVVKAINGIDRLSCKTPSGAFYIFVNIQKLNRSAEEVAEFLLNDAGLTLVPGTAFGENGKGYLRLSYANSYENLVEACERIKKSVQKL